MDLGEYELGKSSSEIFGWLAFHRLRSPSLHKTFDFRFAILATRGGILLRGACLCYAELAMGFTQD